MKGFTLFEATYAILILSIIFTIVFYGFSFNKEFFYLKNFVKELRLALETTNDMSQRTIFKRENDQSYLFCGYGLYFPSSTYYEVLGFYTTSTECDLVFEDENKISNFINQGLNNNKYYVTYYGDLINELDPKLILNKNFKGNILISTSTNCNNHLNFPVILLSIYSTSEFYLFLGGSNWSKITSNNIYICLTYKRDVKILRVNKIGQIFVEK